MSVFYRGADLIYRIKALYSDTSETIDPAIFSAITATFSIGNKQITYTLDDSEIVINGNYIDIYIQRADFENKNQGSWNLKITTEEADTNFSDNIRVRIGEIINAFRLDEACK